MATPARTYLCCPLRIARNAIGQVRVDFLTYPPPSLSLSLRFGLHNIINDLLQVSRLEWFFFITKSTVLFHKAILLFFRGSELIRI